MTEYRYDPQTGAAVAVASPVGTPGGAYAVAGAQTAGAPVYAAPAPAHAAAAAAPAAAYAASAAAEEPKKKNTGFIVAIVILSVLLLGALGFASCSAMMATANSFSGLSGLSSLYGYNNSPVATTGPTVAVIDIDSTIEYGNGACGPEGLIDLLTQAEQDDNIKAIVLHVNSGGGTATAGEEMAAAVKACTKPVVVSSAASNASAAYEISSQADYIFVNKATFIGSIGTAMQFVDMSGLYDMIGIRYIDIVSSESKDSSYGNRSLTDEEVAYYTALVKRVTEAFIETVAEGRGMSIEAVRALATGQVFTGEEAVENGLADAVGTFEDACAYAAKLGGIQDSYAVTDITYVYYDYGSIMDILDLLLEDDTQVSAEDILALLHKGTGLRAVGIFTGFATE